MHPCTASQICCLAKPAQEQVCIVILLYANAVWSQREAQTVGNQGSWYTAYHEQQQEGKGAQHAQHEGEGSLTCSSLR